LRQLWEKGARLYAMPRQHRLWYCSV